MDSQQALHAAVVEDPEDILARLASADWLEENGDLPKSLFLRTQLALASVPRDWPEAADRVRKLSALNRELLDQFGATWSAPITGRGVRGVGFSLGFVEHIECTARSAVEDGARWAAAVPLRGITVRAAAGNAAALARCPHLGRIRSLTITDRRFGDEDLAELAQSPYLGRLTALQVQGFRSGTSPRALRTRVGDPGLAALAGSPLFRNLAVLTVNSDGSITSAGVESLATAARQEVPLRGLVLAYTAVDDRGALALASAAGLRNLEVLGVLGGGVGNDGLLALLSSRHLRRLTSLSLNGHQVTANIMRDLAVADLPPGLRLLDIGGNPLWGLDVGAVVEVCDRHPGLRLGLGTNFRRGVRAELSGRLPGRLLTDPGPPRPGHDGVEWVPAASRGGKG